MPRDGSNIYSAPAGTTATAGTTIESAKYNAFVNDLVTDANTARPIVAGGTGATTAGAALAALGGQPLDAGLTSIAGLTTAADRMIYTTAADTYAVATLTAAGRALLDDADAAAQRTTLGAQAALGFTPVEQGGASKINLAFDGVSARLTVDGIDVGRLIRNSESAAGLNGVIIATGDAPLYAARAWVNFNGTGTVAIRASGNVSSITDNGTGDYTINFSTAMPDANYTSTATCSFSGGGSAQWVRQFAATSKLTGSDRFVVLNAAGTAVDSDAVCIVMHR